MDVPPNVLAAVAAATAHDLFPVSGTEVYDGQVLRTERLQFDSGASLRLARIDLLFLVVWARRILLRAPEVRSQIVLNPNAGVVKAPSGVAGGTVTLVAHSLDGLF